MEIKKPELLSPAGNLEKLKYAIHYGADAVYMGLPTFGLRSNKKAFDWDSLEEGINYARNNNVKVYITTNIFARNHELERLPNYLKKLAKLEPDGFILADPGIMQAVKEYVPRAEIHLSTQSSVMNWLTAKFWHDAGVDRIVLARELNLREIETIKEKNPGLEIETFIHGAMCMAYSGRCMISSYLNSRDANHGDCTNACRWNYKLVEETRPGVYFPVVEDEEGTYFFNAKDLCLVTYIPDLIEAGVCSLKIEGRTKSNYYLSIVTRAYRQAIDAYLANPHNFDPLPYLQEILTTSNRTFSSGFIGNDSSSAALQNHDISTPVQYYDFVAMVQSYDEESNIAVIEGRNRINPGETLEFVTRDQIISQKIEEIRNFKDEIVSKVDPNKIYKIRMDKKVDSFTLVRRRNQGISTDHMQDIINDEYHALSHMKALKN